jgi:Polyketide cyclase / dehydrase and lipid transport/Protein of unknown function (DUF2934)
MGTTTHSIDVKAPLKSVYDQWTQFEEFPRFMRDVVEVRQHGPDALSWKVLMGGKEKQWEARIIEQIPDTSIVWESVDGTSNRGSVTFEPLGTDATRLTVVMEYEPEGFLEKAGDILGVPSGHVEESLKSFRELIESKSTATGGWRGRIESTDLENATVDKDIVPEPATTPVGDFRASNEAETYRQEVPVTQTGRGEHEAAMVARPNDTDQELQRRSISQETETPSLHTTDSVPHPAFQAVPVTDLEAGEHEAGMISRVSEPDQEEIARRAYDLYLARGQAAGHEMDDWIEGKRQLLEERNSQS